MRLRRSVVAFVLTTGVLVPVVATVTTASASAAASSGTAYAAKKAKPVKSAKPAKPAKVAFTATGVVTAVDAGAATLTVAVKGGTKNVKGNTVTVVVPSTARITLSDVPVA